MTEAQPYPVPPVDPKIVDKWDSEWMLYLSTETKWPHLLQASRLVVINDVTPLDRKDMFQAILTQTRDGEKNVSLRIWAKGQEIVGKRVAEIGCGAGFLGKQLGLIVDRYLGIDVSQLSLAIARGNSGPACTYLHLSDEEFIRKEFCSYDTVVGREFFIHQNFANAEWVLKLAKALLVPGGVVCADFYLPNRAIPQGILHPARSGLDPNYASCAFLFSEGDIRDVAKIAQLEVLSIEDSLNDQRRFVVFQSPSA